MTRPTDADRLLEFATSFTLFATPEGEAYAALPLGQFGKQAHPVRSHPFRCWLLYQFDLRYGRPPSDSALRRCLQTLESRALCGAKRQSVGRRVAAHGGGLSLDLSDSQGRAVVISAKGWHVSCDSRAPFTVSRSALPLPSPDRSWSRRSAFSRLARLLGCRESSAAQTLVEWLASAARHDQPRRPLILQAASPSHARAAAAAVRACLDPSAGPVLDGVRPSQLPHVARQNWIVALAAPSRISHEFVSGVLALTHGVSVLYRDRAQPEPQQTTVARPVILAVSSACMLPAELEKASVCLHLEAGAEQENSTALLKNAEALRPALLAALSDHLSAGLQSAPEPAATPRRTAAAGKTHSSVEIETSD